MQRAFLIPGVALLCGAAALACGGSGDDSPEPTSTESTSTTAAATQPATQVDAPPMVNGLPACLPPGSQVAGSPFEAVVDPVAATPPDERSTIVVSAVAADLYKGVNNLSIGIADPETKLPIGNAQVRMTLYKISGETQQPVCQVEGVGSAPGVGPETQHTHGDGQVHVHGGEDENRSVHYAHMEFDAAGNWGLAVEAILKDGSHRFGTVLLQVGDEPFTPAPGDPVLKSDNLTKDDVANISEIDSGDPPNDMHDYKIKDLAESGRPFVVVFSTPAYCTSAFCGPVNQEVEAMYEKYKADVDFVHIEIWRDRTANPPVLNPTAREWLMRPDGGLSEPVVYVVGKDGTIFDRWDGPVAANIMEASIQAVAGGATFAP